MIVSFTGNRNTQKTSDICWRLHERIEDYIKLGCKKFLCGGAAGADTLFSLSLIKHKEKYKDIKLILYLPCKNQDKLWSQEQKKQYKEILEKADEIIYVSEEYTETCMLLRNIKLIENSTHLLSIFDGVPKGGTHYTIQKALKAENIKEIYTIKP